MSQDWSIVRLLGFWFSDKVIPTFPLPYPFAKADAGANDLNDVVPSTAATVPTNFATGPVAFVLLKTPLGFVLSLIVPINIANSSPFDHFGV